MAQICPACKTSNPDAATTCKNCHAALPGEARTKPAAAAAANAASAGAARRAASSGAIAEAARRAAAQQRAAQQAAQQAARPATGGGSAGGPPRAPVRVPRPQVTSSINRALDSAGLPRFSTQRYLVIWAGFAVVVVLVIIALFWFGASAGRQATVPPTAQPGAVLTGTVATFATTQGVFTITVTTAPTMTRTVDNFRRQVASGYYDGKLFHRVENWVVQTGAPNCTVQDTRGCASGGGSLRAEYNDLPFDAGSVGMASTEGHALNVNDSQFFIVKTAAPSLTGQYPNFAQVTGGLDVVDKLHGCTPKTGGAAGDLDCTGADKIITATLGLK